MSYLCQNNVPTEWLGRTADLPDCELFSMCGWAKKVDAYAFQDGVGGIWGPDSLRFIYYSASGVLSVRHGNGPTVDFGTSPTAGEWFFWAITCNGTSLKAYWAYDDSTTWDETLSITTSSFDATTKLFAGANGYANPLGGNVTAVKVWDAELSSAELLAEKPYRNAVRTSGLHLQSWLIADANDSSGNGRDWTINGSPTLEGSVEPENLTIGPGLVWTKTANPAWTAQEPDYEHVNFDSVPIGPASADRIVVALTHCNLIIGVTVNGAAMNPRVQSQGAGRPATIWTKGVPSGTVADFVIESDYVDNGAGLIVGILTGAVESPSSVASTNHNSGAYADPHTCGPIAVPNGGIGLCCVVAYSGAVAALIWDSGVEDYSVDDAYQSHLASGRVSASGDQTFSVSNADYYSVSLAAAAWEPIGPLVWTKISNSGWTYINWANPYTFSAVAIGAASADRVVVCCYKNTHRTIASATIGGIAATIAVQNAELSQNGSIFYAAVPTGTTADVVITHNEAGPLYGCLMVGILTGANATPTDTNVFNSVSINDLNSFPLTVTIPPSGITVQLVSAEAYDTTITPDKGTTEYSASDANAPICYMTSYGTAGDQTINYMIDCVLVSNMCNGVAAAWEPSTNFGRSDPCWGDADPSPGEFAVSWQGWQTEPMVPVTVSGDPDWGACEVAAGTPCLGPVADYGNANVKTFTVTKDKYATGSGTTTIYIRGSASIFAQHDASPSWVEYTAPTEQAWRYVQLKLES